LVGPVGF